MHPLMQVLSLVDFISLVVATSATMLPHQSMLSKRFFPPKHFADIDFNVVRRQTCSVCTCVGFLALLLRYCLFYTGKMFFFFFVFVERH
jgi:hypothetical protein